MISSQKGCIIVAYFFETSDTIPEGLGFEAYGPLHLIWLAALAAVLAVTAVIYKRLGEDGKRRLLKVLGVMIFASEIVRDSILIYAGHFDVSCLPLHLCGINIFIVLIYAFYPKAVLAEYLFAVCMPGALAALLFPSWTALPVTSFCHIHSFVFHLWLFMFPFLLLIGGFRPSFARLWRSLPYTIPVVVFVYIFNKIFDTDYMFLNGGGEGNPIAFFADLLGDPLYLITIPFLIAIVWGAMYGIPCLFRKVFFKEKRQLMPKYN